MELSKGCRRDLCPQPVDLEPPYCSLGASDPDDRPWVLQPAVPRDQLYRLAVWISPEQNCEWRRSELFLKQLCGIHYRAALELVGNRQGIGLRMQCHRLDAGVVHTAFLSQFEQCRLSRLVEDPFQALPASVWQQAAWSDFFPPPPYSHLLTQPNELQHSPLAVVFAPWRRFLRQPWVSTRFSLSLSIRNTTGTPTFRPRSTWSTRPSSSARRPAFRAQPSRPVRRPAANVHGTGNQGP